MIGKPFYAAPFGPRHDVKKLSAVVLTYNKASVFKIFFDSLMAQTRKPDEVIVVDDASTDGTQDVLRKHCHFWKIVLLPKNKGQSHARNVGARYVHGEYVIFLDGDIEMHPKMLERLEHSLDHFPDSSIAYGHYDRCGSRTDNVKGIRWNAEELRRMNYITMMSMIRRRDMPMPPFDESLRRYEDWDLWLRMVAAGKKGQLVNEVLFVAYYQDGDLSGRGESKMWYEIVKRKHGLPDR